MYIGLLNGGSCGIQIALSIGNSELSLGNVGFNNVPVGKSLTMKCFLEIGRDDLSMGRGVIKQRNAKFNESYLQKPFIFCILFR